MRYAVALMSRAHAEILAAELTSMRQQLVGGGGGCEEAVHYLHDHSTEIRELRLAFPTLYSASLVRWSSADL